MSAELRPWPDAGGGMCCYGTIIRGPEGCICWEPVHDQPQEPPRPGPQEVRPGGMCGDCAYRPRSPERTGSQDAAGDWELLQSLAEDGRPFHCHDGMRAITGYRHPAGTEVPASTAGGVTLEWDPPIIDSIPYRADGTPALLCAGWAALRRRAAEACGQPVDNLWTTCGQPSECQPKPYDNTLSNRVADVSHAYDNMHDLTPETGQKTPKISPETARKPHQNEPPDRGAR